LRGYWTLDGAVGGSGAEIINHSRNPNLVSRILKAGYAQGNHWDGSRTGHTRLPNAEFGADYIDKGTEA
jgi:hypothetical protein